MIPKPFLRFFALIIMLPMMIPMLAAQETTTAEKKQIMRGPLRISALQTVSTNHGKIVDGEGDVAVKYEAETKDTFESFSQYAHYDEEKGIGEIWGSPRAVWKRADPAQPQIHLIADKITLALDRLELTATGNVTVTQASSTLKAQQVKFFNAEKKITAEGNRPFFTLLQPQQRIKISSEKIFALTEKKQIQFDEKVSGVVEFQHE